MHIFDCQFINRLKYPFILLSLFQNTSYHSSRNLHNDVLSKQVNDIVAAFMMIFLLIEITFQTYFCLLRFYLLFVVCQLLGRYCLYLSNHCCLLYCIMHILDHLFLDLTDTLILIFSFNNIAVLIVKQSKFKTFIQRLLI